MRPWFTRKTVTLKSHPNPSNNVTVDVSIDLDGISRDDLRFVGAILAMIGAYEPGPEDADLFTKETT